MRLPRFSLTVLLCALLAASPPAAWAQFSNFDSIEGFDRESALAVSQAAIGGQLGDYEFTDPDGQIVRLTDLAGEPLAISLIYTSCYHSCPVTTRRLRAAVLDAREVLGDDSFRVVTVGFDSANDSPDRMRTFAREQGIDIDGWLHLSASAETIAALSADVGFIAVTSPRGFDHIAQVTVVDRESTIVTQVYGEMFELPWLVEPLKQLVFDRPLSGDQFLSGLVNDVRIFCTVYDPRTGGYKFDYSLFIQIAIGLFMVLSISFYLLREILRSRRDRKG
jgi:protein SCO1/2